MTMNVYTLYKNKGKGNIDNLSQAQAYLSWI